LRNLRPAPGRLDRPVTTNVTTAPIKLNNPETALGRITSGMQDKIGKSNTKQRDQRSNKKKSTKQHGGSLWFQVTVLKP